MLCLPGSMEQPEEAPVKARIGFPGNIEKYQILGARNTRIYENLRSVFSLKPLL